MADPVVHIVENSPEAVAYKLFLDIVAVESRVLHRNAERGFSPASKEWILQTYRECIAVVKGTQRSNRG